MRGTDTPGQLEIPNTEDVAAHEAKRKLKLMARTKIREPGKHDVGEILNIWRGGKGWVGQVPMRKICTHEVSVNHNNCEKTAIRNLFRRITSADEEGISTHFAIALPDKTTRNNIGKLRKPTQPFKTKLMQIVPWKGTFNRTTKDQSEHLKGCSTRKGESLAVIRSWEGREKIIPNWIWKAHLRQRTLNERR